MDFTVTGIINAQFTPEGGSPVNKHIANMLVELWHKSPLEIIFLGSGLTESDGSFNIQFAVDDSSPMLTGGSSNEIEEVFLKVYYKNKLIIGDIDSNCGSFD